jgi:hypothetical protein
MGRLLIILLFVLWPASGLAACQTQAECVASITEADSRLVAHLGSLGFTPSGGSTRPPEALEAKPLAELQALEAACFHAFHPDEDPSNP